MISPGGYFEFRLGGVQPSIGYTKEITLFRNWPIYLSVAEIRNFLTILGNNKRNFKNEYKIIGTDYNADGSDCIRL